MALTTLPPPLPAAGAHIAHHIARTAEDLPTRKGVTYIWAANGLFKHAWNGATRAMVQVGYHHTPGLGELRPFVSWKGWPHPLPAGPLNEALADAIARYTPEAPLERQWFVVLRGGAPALLTPEQDAGSIRLAYAMPKDRVLADVHSHHGMPPFFSGTDDADDAWLGLSIVIGRLGSPYPSAVARINCYGAHSDVELAAIVEGELRVGALPLVPEREAMRGTPMLRHQEALGAALGPDEEAEIFAELDEAERSVDEPEAAAGQ
jgi:PRTRC genetic system protein A